MLWEDLQATSYTRATINETQVKPMGCGESGPIMDAHDFINKELEIIAMLEVKRDWECSKHIMRMCNWLWYVIIGIYVKVWNVCYNINLF